MPKKSKGPSTHQRTSAKGGKFFPALSSVVGMAAILAVIALLLPISIPRVLGYEVYNIVSGSMAPSIPQGSLVLVRPADWREIAPGDVIAFDRAGAVVTHRVTQLREGERAFVTKGDANVEEDMAPVPFEDLIGRVERHYPYLGAMASLAAGTAGKLRLAGLLLAGILFRTLGSRLRKD